MYKINPKLLQTPVTDGNILLLEPESGQYFELNETSVLVFQGIIDELDNNALVQKVVERYTTNKAQARADVLSTH